MYSLLMFYDIRIAQRSSAEKHSEREEADNSMVITPVKIISLMWSGRYSVKHQDTALNCRKVYKMFNESIFLSALPLFGRMLEPIPATCRQSQGTPGGFRSRLLAKR